MNKTLLRTTTTTTTTTKNDLGPCKSVGDVKIECGVQGMTTLFNEKQVNREKYLRSKKSSQRYSNEHERKRKARLYKERLQKLTQVVSGEDIKPHALALNELMEFVPQNVGMFNDIMKYLASIKEGTDDNIVFHVENILLLCYDFYNCKSYTDVLIATIKYVKYHLNGKSFAQQVYDVIYVMAEEFNLDEFIPHGMQDILDGWNMMKSNPVFHKISYLVSLAMSISVCSMNNIKWTLDGLKMIHEVHKSDFFGYKDIVDAIIHSFTWMSETAVWCFESKSLAPILYSDRKLHEWTEMCTYVLSHADAAKAGNVEDMHTYERKLDECMRTTAKMQAATPSPAVKEVLQNKYIKLVNVKQDIIAKHKNTQLRFAPFGISIFGESSIGKSNISDLTMKTCLNAMGYDDDPAGIITLSEADKYDSQYTSDVMGVKIDDVANQRSEFMQEAPTRKYITMFNSVAAQAVKAELNEKGTVFFNFKVGVITTNVRDLDARLYANYPVAVLRRFVHVTASVKDKYKIPGGDSLNTDHPDLVNHDNPHEILDVWQFDVFEVIPCKGKPVWRPIVHNNKECNGLSLEEYLDVCIFLSKKHSDKQRKEVEKSKALAEMKCCRTCSKLPQFCKCAEPHSETLSKIIYMGVRDGVISGLTSWWWKPLTSLLGSVVLHQSKAATKVLRQQIESGLTTAVPVASAMVPDCIYYSNTFQSGVHKFYKSTHTLRCDIFQKILWSITLMGVCGSLYNKHYCACLFTLMVGYCGTVLLQSHRDLQIQNCVMEYNARRDAIKEYAETLKSHWVTKAALATVVVGSIAFFIRQWYKMYEAKPNSVDVAAEDAKPGWMNSIMAKMYMKVKTPDECKNMIPAHIEKKILNNMMWGSFDFPTYTNKCGVFFPRKSVMWFPKHIMFKDNNLDGERNDSCVVTLTRYKNMPGGKFKVRIDYEACFEFPGLDMLGCYVPNSPDFPSLKSLPQSLPVGDCLGKILIPRQDSIDSDMIHMSFQKVAHTYLSMYGCIYRSAKVAPGSCMGPIISEAKNPCVVGFHIGGNPNSCLGIAQTVTQEMADACYAFLDNRFILSAETGVIPHTQYDVELLTSTEVNPKALYVKEMTEDNFVEVLGSTHLRSEQKSEVVESILSPDIEQICGVPQQWGKPKLSPNWKAYNTNIEYFSKPADMFPTLLLEKAVADYLEPLEEAMLEYVKQEDFRPLTMHENICGIPGKKFLDPLPMNTGIGFPLMGKKNKCDANGEPLHFVEQRLGEVLVSRVPKDHILKEFERMESCWRKNERGYPVTTATLKDEPTKLTKEKVRVFQAAPLSLSLGIRKYFLPVARFLHMHSIKAESAVGINCFSHDWEKIMGAALKYADDGNALAWDYAKYDVRMNSQIVRAAWGIFIRLAEVGGYCKEDLDIMKAMIVDIAHPLMDINGTMLMSFNMNTSGNNMTVDVNGVAGSLLVRMGFFHVYPELKNFRRYVGAATYGDDFTGSNHTSTRKFNFETYKAFLAEYGMTITLPSKTDDVCEFLPLDQIDFLKRKSYYIPEIDCSIGQLDENSIFKSLHANLKSSSQTPRQVAASCIESALNEWFAFGREHYEMRRMQMQKVCEKHAMPLPVLNVTFDERVAHWKEKYAS
jgi:hypothetical protein